MSHQKGLWGPIHSTTRLRVRWPSFTRAIFLHSSWWTRLTAFRNGDLTSGQSIASCHACADFFPGVPILALTASATAIVEKDVLRSLSLKNVVCFRDSFERNNLFLEVRHKSSQNQALEEIVSLIKSVAGPQSICGILYVTSREDVERMS